MKTTIKLIIAAIAALTTFASCQKENAANNGNINPSTDGLRVLTLSFDSGTKATLNGLQPEFQNGEYVMISNGTTCEEKQVSVTNGVATITTSLSGSLTAVIPSSAAKMDEYKIVGVNIPKSQSGLDSDALICLAQGAADATSLHFTCQTALFIVTPPAGVKRFTIQASGAINSSSVPYNIYVGNEREAYGTYYVSLLPGVKLNQLTFVTDSAHKTINSTTTTTANTAYTINNSNWIPDGALSGEFSVASGKQVHFSQGNLIATIDNSGAPTAWRFATNQYDYIGEGGANKTIGTADGDVDLFGWVGSNSSLPQYGICASSSDSAYGNVLDESLKSDWGNAIDDRGTWRTLTTSEWQYLFGRTVNGGTGEGKSFQRSTINSDETGVYGMILYPDNYTAQTAATSYTSSEWVTMETAGCVFLPAAGYRDGSVVGNVGERGNYWSSSSSSDDESAAFYVHFRSDKIIPNGDIYRSNGNSVRLVTDVE